MHIVSTKTEAIQGVIKPPPSKSETIRAVFFGNLCTGTSHIRNMLASEDVSDAIKACAMMSESSAVFTGSSGLTTRLMLPLLGLRANTSTPVTFDCGTQMRARPMAGLINALNQIGMNIDSSKWPLTVSGRLTGGTVALTEPISQFLSALLIALPLAENDSVITFPDIPAWSYVEMTLNWLKRLGILYTEHQNSITIPGNQQYKAFDYTVPSDFSSASYFIAAAAMLGGSVRITGIDMNDTQGDKQLIEIIQRMGGNIAFDGSDIMIHGSKFLNGVRIDASNIPDLLPTLAVLGTAASGKTEIINAKQARLKETDRIHSMTEGLTRMGARIEESNDGMTIYSSKLSGASVKGYQDHRTVMALSLAGLLAEGKTVIDDAASIHKTFPEFVTHMKSLGANMEINA